MSSNNHKEVHESTARDAVLQGPRKVGLWCSSRLRQRYVVLACSPGETRELWGVFSGFSWGFLLFMGLVEGQIDPLL